MAAVAFLIPLPVLIIPQHIAPAPRAGPLYNNRLMFHFKYHHLGRILAVSLPNLDNLQDYSYASPHNPLGLHIWHNHTLNSRDQ